MRVDSVADLMRGIRIASAQAGDCCEYMAAVHDFLEVLLRCELSGGASQGKCSLLEDQVLLGHLSFKE